MAKKSKVKSPRAGGITGGTPTKSPTTPDIPWFNAGTGSETAGGGDKTSAAMDGPRLRGARAMPPAMVGISHSAKTTDPTITTTTPKGSPQPPKQVKGPRKMDDPVGVTSAHTLSPLRAGILSNSLAQSWTVGNGEPGTSTSMYAPDTASEKSFRPRTLSRHTSIKVDVPSFAAGSLMRGAPTPTATHLFLSNDPCVSVYPALTPGSTEPQSTPTMEKGALRRRESKMVRSDRAPHYDPTHHPHGARPPAMRTLLATPDNNLTRTCNIWTTFVTAVTCCIPPVLLRTWGGMSDRAVQQAWREKLALCFIILAMCAALGFLTYGFVATVCIAGDVVSIDEVRAFTPQTFPHHYIIKGVVYDATGILEHHRTYPGFRNGTYSATTMDAVTGIDITPFFFPAASTGSPQPLCQGLMTAPYTPPCTTPALAGAPITYCHNPTAVDALLAKYPSARLGPVVYEWPDIVDDKTTLLVFKENVLDMRPYLATTTKPFGAWADGIIRTHLGKDMTRALAGSPERIMLGKCLVEWFVVGRIEEKSVGCIASDIVLYVSLIMILSVVLIRFGMAVMFSWFVSWRLGRLEKEHAAQRGAVRRLVLEQGIVPFPMRGKLDGGSGRPSVDGAVKGESGWSSRQASRDGTPVGSRRASLAPPQQQQQQQNQVVPPMPNSNNLTVGRASISSDISGNTLVGARQFNLEHARAEAAAASHTSPASSPYGLEVYTVMLVTAYSEGEAGLRATMDSLAETNYSDDHKLMFIVADGLIVGEGKPRTTPQVVCDLLEMDKNWPSPPAPMSYVAIAEGPKRHNMAQVYVAWYNYKDRCIPTILVVKCGTPEENEPPKDASAPKTKPGNRGKRDSQIILMSFFQKITFDDQMSPLDYDLFQKIHYLMGVTPDQFEIVLMVDADTKVAPDSLPRMVASMVTDPMVMGLCGETRIANKSESWVSKIQVFEYYLSHHLAKAFESVFGGVTCLPGCFCMYRIKAPKGNGYWVPILCNPDIVATYSQNRVDTLHKKNLLLLGEDRFLTTLMLGTFPHRKQLFVPAAYCKTVVPTTFKVLLSQRRRWINSTIHNLMELVLVRKLCGVFCFSMQFVIMLELVGTVVLPAAIIFTFLLIIMSIIGPTVPYIPLALLGAILGLPAVLIMLTTRRRVYVLWMLIYLLALPVWNLVLPVYAFWHFDDFSWGQTRVVEGEAGGGDKGGHGNAAGPGQERDGGEEVVRRRWVEWETERRRAIVTEYHLEQQHLELEARQREQEEAEANEPNE